jgi:hypothetical protein
MSYTITRTNGAQVAVVADGTIDATLDLKLIGKNYAGYGGVQNENFVYLLENFASNNPPARPIPGQVWFDSGTSKLKFYDGNKFRTTGGAEIKETAPTGLTVGDFWFDTVNKQLWAFTGATNEPYTLIGPQGVAGSQTITQMRSVSLLDDTGTAHAVIQAIDDDVTIFTISTEEFTLNDVNPIDGFTKIRQGVTLCYTNDDATNNLGQTQTGHRFWGTSTDSERLGGLLATSFIRADGANFTNPVNFSHAGFTVGDPQALLRIYNKDETTPTIYNQQGKEIVFKTTVSGNETTSNIKFTGRTDTTYVDILPSITLVSNIGSENFQFKNVYADKFKGTADKADLLSVNGNYRSASTDSSINTIAARDSNGYINAVVFQGVATSANYADLAENYLADGEYEVGTVLMVGGEKEVTPCQVGFRAVGPVSEKPAHLMNSGLEGGTAIALKGRVPVKVIGNVIKGQRMVAGANGTAQAAMGNTADVFAIALESNSEAGVKLVECLIL